MKRCTKCGIEKDESQFSKTKKNKDGLNYHCKQCSSAISRDFYYKNKERILQQRLEYYKINRDVVIQRSNTRYEQNKDKIKAYQVTYKRNRSKIDPSYRIGHLLRTRVCKLVKGITSSGSAIYLLGCCVEELKLYLEDKFQPGMSWDNYTHTGWHIDHVLPLASFDLTDLEQRKKAFHYTNLQPLWGKDNMSKGAKIDL